MKKTLLAFAVALAMPLGVIQGQTTGAGCFNPLFNACASWSLTNTGSNYSLTLSNTTPTPTSVKFSEVILWYSGAEPTIASLTSSPTGWSMTNKPFNGTFYIGSDPTEFKNALNFEFNGPNGDKFIDAGESVTLNFTATAGSAFSFTAIGTHAQGGPNGQSMRVQFVCAPGSTLPECGGGGGGECTQPGGCVVPEPNSYILMASGMAGLGFLARRRRRFQV